MKVEKNDKYRLIDSKLVSQIALNNFETQTKKPYEIQNDNEMQFEFIAANKNNGWINTLCQLTNSKIFVKEKNEDVIEINVQLAMTKQLIFDFVIVITKGKDVFDFIPNNINFEFSDTNDEIFTEQLEISINDLSLLIERFLEIRNKQLYKVVNSK